MQNVFHLWRVFNDSSVVFFQAQNIYVNLNPIVHSHVFGLPLPFKVAIQLFGILHQVPFNGVYFKIRAFVPSTKSKELHKGAPFPATGFIYLCKYDNCIRYAIHNCSL